MKSDLQNIKNLLQDSTKRSWIEGDINEWFQHANQMKSTINLVITMIDTLIKKEKE